MVAHRHHHVVQRKFAARTEIEGHHLGLADVAAVSVVKIAVHAVYPFVEETPDARLAVTDGAKVGGRIGVGKREFAVLSFEISLLAGETDHVGSVEHVLFIFKVELVNAALVGMCRNAIVGNAHRYPNSAFASRTFADHFQYPDFIRVSNGERLTLRGVAVKLHERRHHLDGLACRL